MADDPPKMPPVESRWKPGQSGNPTGRPRELMAFRTRCRKLSRRLLDIIRRRMNDPDVSLADLVSAFKAISDRGGFLPADRLGSLEANHTRIVQALVTVGALVPEERMRLLDALEKQLEGEVDAG
jgi:hypothetical protein